MVGTENQPQSALAAYKPSSQRVRREVNELPRRVHQGNHFLALSLHELPACTGISADSHLRNLRGTHTLRWVSVQWPMWVISPHFCRIHWRVDYHGLSRFGMSASRLTGLCSRHGSWWSRYTHTTDVLVSAISAFFNVLSPHILRTWYYYITELIICKYVFYFLIITGVFF